MNALKSYLPGLVLAILIAGSACADSVDQRMIDGLLARRLYRLAETYCQQRLQADDISSRRRIELTVELSRTFAEQALNSPPRERSVWWKKASEVIDELIGQQASEPHIVIARRQEALVPFGRGQLARHEAAIVADAEPLLQTARDQLRTAISKLRQLKSDLDAQLVRRARDDVDDDKTLLSADEIRILLHDVRYQLARALRNQGLCYPAGTPDRTNSLATAAEEFELLAAITEPIDWNSRVELLACHRELGETVKFNRYARELLELKPPSGVVARIQLQQARDLIEREQTDAALALLGRRGAMMPAVAAQWDYLHLVAVLSAWKSEKDQQVADRYRQRAIKLVGRIETAHGPYWMRRAEGLMGHYVSSAPVSADLAILSRAAASFYRAGKLDEAVGAYDRAREAAVSVRNSVQAFDLAFKSASILHEQRQFVAARDRFQRLALASPLNERAAAAHVLAIYNSAQLLRQQSKPDIDAYVTLLEEHLAHWSAAETADQVHMWLGRVHQSRRNWRSAVDNFRKVRLPAKQYAAAIAAAADCYQRLLAQMDPEDAEFQKRATAAAEFFKAVATGTKDDKQRRPVWQEAVLQAAKFQIHFARRDSGESEQLLRDALAFDPDAPAKWKTTARALLVSALAAQPEKLGDAQAELSKLVEASPRDVVQLITGLSESARDAPVRSQRALAQLQLRSAELLEHNREQLDAATLCDLDRAVAEAYITTSRPGEAREIYKRLAGAHPNDGAIQVGYAEVLLSTDDSEAWKTALTKWREIERRSPAKTERWFHAKYSQALAHYKLGNSKQAARIIQLTRLLHSDLGGADMKVRFLELLQKCQKTL